MDVNDARVYKLAEQINDSPELMAIYAAPEWNCLDDDGKAWVAGLVKQTMVVWAERWAFTRAAAMAIREGDNEDRALRMVAELATMTDIECEFIDGYAIKEAARLLAIGECATIPRLYSEEDRQRARDAVFARFYNPGLPTKQVVSSTTGEIVDLVAEALGMRRAGA